jgi:hypothetical protein
LETQVSLDPLDLLGLRALPVPLVQLVLQEEMVPLALKVKD